MTNRRNIKEDLRSPLLRRILALLEEAGEEDILTIVNTIAKGRYLPSELREIAIALLSLSRFDLLAFAQSFDDKTGAWTILPPEIVVKILTNLEHLTQWSDIGSYWTWSNDQEITHAILTESGRTEAEKILSQEGWKVRGDT